MKRKNLFLPSYLSIVAVCFILFSVAFEATSWYYDYEEQKRFNQQKADLIMKEFENQLQLMDDISLRIVSNYEFQTYYFKGSIDKEWSMLRTLSHYKYISALTEDIFLLYNDSYIYRSTDSTLDMNLYLDNNLIDEWEIQTFLEKITYLREHYTDIRGCSSILSFSKKIYILTPFRVKDISGGQSVAIISMVVEKDALEERFQIASGGYKGNLALYQESELLYSNNEPVDIRNEKNVFVTVSTDGFYTLYYLPENISILPNSMSNQIILVLIDLVLVIIIVFVWAEKSQKPLRNITERYQNQLMQSDQQYKNVLEEIGYLIDSVIESNTEANIKNEKQQKLLKNYFLSMLLQNNNPAEILSNLSEYDIKLEASNYRIISFSYSRELFVTDDFIDMVVEEIENITQEGKKEYVYACCDYIKKMIYVVTNYNDLEGENALTDVIIDVAESFSYTPIVGIGSTYTTLDGLYASWMESVEKIHRQEHKQDDKGSSFAYDIKYVQLILNALEIGNVEVALAKLNDYVTYLNMTEFSFLMLQYIVSDFMGEISRLSRKYNITLSVPNVSMMLSSRSIDDFENAATKMISEFCKEYELNKNALKEKELLQIYEYINAHFTEYDISLENVAEIFRVNVAIVRQSTLKYADKNYKDYIIFLRIELAKKLLQEQKLPIAEVSKKIGYVNVSYFIRLFREVVGVTPANYRKSIINRADYS